MSTATAVRTFAIDKAHSEAAFQVRHLITKVRGRFSDFDGTIEFDEAQPARSQVTLAIQAASIDTGVADRDAHLRSADFFDAGRYPTLTFRSTRVDALGPGRLRLLGTLTIRDVTRTVALDATLNGRGVDPDGREVAGISAVATISRRDFGLTWNVALEAGGVLVGDAVTIALEIEAIRLA